MSAATQPKERRSMTRALLIRSRVVCIARGRASIARESSAGTRQWPLTYEPSVPTYCVAVIRSAIPCCCAAISAATSHSLRGTHPASRSIPQVCSSTIEKRGRRSRDPLLDGMLACHLESEIRNRRGKRGWRTAPQSSTRRHTSWLLTNGSWSDAATELSGNSGSARQ